PERLTVRLARVEEQRTLRSDGDVRWATLCPDHGSCPRRLLGAEDGRDAALGLSRWRRGKRQGSSATLPPGVAEEPTHRNEPTRPALGPCDEAYRPRRKRERLVGCLDDFVAVAPGAVVADATATWASRRSWSVARISPRYIRPAWLRISHSR